jgi:hypothetical protein
MSRLKRASSWLVNSVLNAVVGAGVVAVGAGLIALLSSAGWLFTTVLSAGIFSVLSLAGIMGVYYYHKTRHMIAIYPDPGFHYEILCKTIRYEIGPDAILHFSRSVHLKARIDNLERYTDKFVWTGGPCKLPMPGSNVNEVRPLLHAGIWTYYDAYFNRTLKKGDKIEISNNWHPITSWDSSSPFTSTASEEPTRKIVFDIRIPKEHRRDDNAILEVMRSIESIHPLRTQTDLKFIDDRLLVELVAEPFRHYRLRWAWKNDAALKTLEEAA